MQTLIKNGKVWQGKAFQDTDVLFDGDSITKVAPSQAVPQDCEVVDATGKYVLPGLVESHAHLCMNGGNSPVSVMHAQSYDRRMLECIISMKRFLSVGFTTVRDCGSLDNEVISLRNAVNSGVLIGPRILACGMALKMTGGHFSGIVVDSPDEVRKAARKELAAGADFIKIMGTGGLGHEGEEPGAAELTEEEMRPACIEAAKHNKEVSVHCHGKEGILNSLHAGSRSIEHASYMDDEVIEALLKYDAFIIPTFTPYVKIGEAGPKPGTWVTPYVWKCACEVNSRKMDQFRNAYKAGVKVAFGRDAGATYTPPEGHVFEMQQMEIGGMSREAIINAATIVAADLLRLKHKIGSIEAGKAADFLLLDANPLDNLESFNQVHKVFKDGKLFENHLI